MNMAMPNPDDLIDAIAIVGLSGRFPGAGSVAEFWAAVQEGRELYAPHTPQTLADAFTDEERAQPNYVPVRAALADPGMFDAPFFGMLPREAALTDPQFRVFLEVCWEALEDAGHDPRRAPGPVGVFGGAAMSTYFLNNILTDRKTVEKMVSNYQLGEFPAITGALPDTLATRVAFKLGLTGPAMTVATACSTSLVAIAQAVQSLRSFQCDMALAGGVSITFPQERGYFHLEGGMASRDGRCRPFDAQASGTIFGHGAGAVVLRRYADAVADGDAIYALIRGIGLNNDGDDKIAFTAPSVTGQALAIAAAQGDACIEPDSIGYVECHGTGTPLGDPVEFEGLKKTFAGVGAGRIQLGSVKANVGHLDAAAGVVGVIKTALMLRHRVIPPMTNYTAPNPMISLDESPFSIPTNVQPWSESGPLRAGVSSLGVGGTNAHVVLEEAPTREAVVPEGLQILPISARSEAALGAAAERLAEALCAPDAPALANAAFTLQEGRSTFVCRTAVVARTNEEAAKLLRGPLRPVRAADTAPPVHFMFPGQGAQYPKMAADLHANEPVFRRIVSEGSEVLAPLIGLDLEALVFGDAPEAEAAATLRNTAVTQPALYLIEYATARLWQHYGVQPTAMVGHSVGEFVAAAIAGTMQFETGLRLIAARGRLMQDQPRGGMLSVRAPVEDVAPFVPAGVDLAGCNAPRLNVYAGPEAAIDAFEAALGGADIACARLHTSHAFHSHMMEPVVDALEQEVARHPLMPPSIPFVSCVTGTWITPQEATDPAYWARHCRAPVRFQDAVQTLVLGDTPPVLLEVGPGRTLSAFASQSLPRDAATVVQSLPDHTRSTGDIETMAAAHGALWSTGVPVDWSLRRRGPLRRVQLPTYPFERSLHWIEPPVPVARQAAAIPAVPAPPAPAQVPTQDSPSQSATEASFPMLHITPDIEIPSPKEVLSTKIFALLSELSGESFEASDSVATFLELGFDSLLLGQVAQRLGRDFGVELTFRQLMTQYSTVDTLAAHMADILPPEALPKAAPVPVADPVVAAASPAQMPAIPGTMPPAEGLAGVFQSQAQAMLALFDSQIKAMGGSAANPAAPAAAPAAPAPDQAQAPVMEPPARTGRAPVKVGAGEAKSDRFDLNRRRAAQSTWTDEQKAFVEALCTEYSARFPTSKSRTQQARAVLADPRTAAGFRLEWKELVFPIVAERSKGARLWDPDGNELIDLVNGFGQTAFGHAPDFVTQAVAAQLEKGFAIGPQTPLAHEVAKKFLAVTGHERVTFCNTGSEAVMAAMRISRSVTGRDTVVCFKGDYHGQFDEVLVKGRASGDPTALPAVTGVPAGSVANMVVLGYGAPEALEWLRENKAEIAAIMIEPVQSRHPELRPRAFCEELRRIATDCGAALIFDEVVTGFRVAPNGMQEHWGIEADLATYGKVVGGGMPVGVLAGKGRFMDALDGGFWSFGDDSAPEVPPTFFAGTFVRHPLVLSAMSAVLDHLAGDTGRALYDRVAPRTAQLRDQLNDILEDRGLPRLVTGFSSWLIVNFADLDPRASLLFPLMRLQDLHVLDGFPWFFTTAHGEEEFERVATAFENSLDRLRSVGILAGEAPAAPQRVPLTEPQKEIWLAAQLGDAASGVFIESGSIRLEGDLDTDALEAALNELVARHDALRMRFSASGAYAEVMPHVHLALRPEDMDATALEQAVAQDAKDPFDLVRGPLIRARLARFADKEHVLILGYHHIVCDGWSAYILMEDLAALYNARVSGTPSVLNESTSFAAFAAQQADRSASAESQAFWTGRFPVAPDLPDLPLDARRTGRRSYAGATHVHTIDAALAKAIKRAAGREGVTIFGALSGVLALMLGRMSGASDITLAVPTAGQTLLPNSRLVGHCVNLVPIPFEIPREAPVKDYLKAASQRILDCFDHGDVTYSTILRATGIRGDASRQPLTEVQFNLDQQPDDFGLSGLRTSMCANPRAHTNFDLIFNVTESPSGLRIDLTYATDVLSEETAAQWCRQYHHMLARMVDGMEAAVGRVPMMDENDARALAELGRGTELKLPSRARIEDLIAEQAVATPEAIAVEDAHRSLTYAELMRESDSFAARVRAHVPEPGSRVAVHVERSVTLVVALLGILKAGHAYVPLDPHHPTSRLRLVLETARVHGFVHDGPPPEAVAGMDFVLIDIDRPTAPAPAPARRETEGETAYFIFTSGSTGTPKGVEVPQRAVVNFLLSMRERPGFTAEDTLLSVTTVSFDIAALELFLPLISGGRVVVAAAQDVVETFPLVERLKRGDITVVQATPTLWQMLLEAGLKADRRLKALVGGEPLPADLAARLSEMTREVWNMYGPTETTIWSSCGLVEGGRTDIGAPIANTSLHILDEFDGLVPLGVAGELNISGEGLATGYFERPDLTEAAFRTVDVPGAGRQRLYRTGDLAARLRDGRLVLLGRRDDQVKLRGFRIELGEVEAAMRSVAGVRAAAVTLCSGAAGPYLAGYYVADASAPSAADIAQTVSSLLPGYMVPTRWQQLDALPQTGNGKLDRRALPEIDTTVGLPGVERRVVPPANPVEETLAKIWSEVLGIDPISTDEDLFQLGADSLSIFRIAARMAEQSIDLEAKHLILHPTIAGAAALVASGRNKAANAPSLKDFRKGARRGDKVSA